MKGRQLGIALTGVVGVAILLNLGAWQLRRLAWKEGVLAEISARMADPQTELPKTPDPATDNYLGVRLSGHQDGPGLRVWSPPSYRLVVPFVTSTGRRVLLDRGLSGATPTIAGEVTLTGNLNWPDDVDRYTPPPEGDLWYGRDVVAMAKALNTEPLLVIAASATGPGVEPLPVTTDGIPNNHRQYAVTWFALAAVWAGMTVLALWRIKRGTN